MILDKQLMFSDGQAITAAAGSENTINMSQARDIGSGKPLHIVVVVTAAFTDGSSNSTLTVALEGDSTDTITPDATQDLFTIPALAQIGDMFVATLSPGSAPLQKQYLRLKYTPNNGDLSTGAVKAFIVQDVAAYKAYAKNYPIT